MSSSQKEDVIFLLATVVFRWLALRSASDVTISADFMALRRLSGVIERLPREELHHEARCPSESTSRLTSSFASDTIASVV